jgi:hypothetical protein
MKAREESLTERLEVILGELECHYYYLLNDSRLKEGRKSKNTSQLVGGLNFVTNCLSAAVQTMQERPIAALIQASEK